MINHKKSLVLGLCLAFIICKLAIHPVPKMTQKVEVYLLLLFFQAITPTFCENICIAEICIPQDYSSAIVPELKNGNKVEVDIPDIQILNVNDFGKQNQSDEKIIIFQLS